MSDAKLKLFLISQTENNDYDTYDSAVVAAPDEETARSIHPGIGRLIDDWSPYLVRAYWCSGPEHVQVKYIGEAAEGIEQGVVCASYNAG